VGGEGGGGWGVGGRGEGGRIRLEFPLGQ